MTLHHDILIFGFLQRARHNHQQFFSPGVNFNTSGVKKNLIYKYDFQLIVYFDDFNLLGGNLIFQAGFYRLLGIIQQLDDFALELDN